MGWSCVLSLPHGFNSGVSVCSQLEGSLVPQVVAALWGVHIPTSLVIQNAGTIVVYH